MFLAVQLESRLIYCLNKACLTASASVISHRTVLTGSRPLGWGWRVCVGEGISSTSLSPSLSLCVFGAVVAAESTAGALLSLTLNGERSWKFRVPGQIYLDRLSFEKHTCGWVKDTWCVLDVVESIPAIWVNVFYISFKKCSWICILIFALNKSLAGAVS